MSNQRKRVSLILYLVMREIQRRKQQVWRLARVSPSDAAQAVNLLNVSIMAKHLLLQGKCQYLSVRRHTKHLAEGQKKIDSKIYERKKLYFSASHVLGCNNKTSFQITVDCSFVAELSKYWYQQRVKNVQKAIKLRFERRF